MKRTLTLRSEHLAELAADELREVGGAGAGADARSGFTCPIEDCFVDSYLGMCWTWIC